MPPPSPAASSLARYLLGSFLSRVPPTSVCLPTGSIHTTRRLLHSQGASRRPEALPRPHLPRLPSHTFMRNVLNCFDGSKRIFGVTKNCSYCLLICDISIIVQGPSSSWWRRERFRQGGAEWKSQRVIWAGLAAGGGAILLFKSNEEVDRGRWGGLITRCKSKENAEGEEKHVRF